MISTGNKTTGTKIDTRTAVTYAATFASAFLAFLVIGLLVNVPPDSGGEWVSFIMWGVLISAIAAAAIGSLFVFRGRLASQRSGERRVENV